MISVSPFHVYKFHGASEFAECSKEIYTFSIYSVFWEHELLNVYKSSFFPQRILKKNSHEYFLNQTDLTKLSFKAWSLDLKDFKSNLKMAFSAHLSISN